MHSIDEENVCSQCVIARRALDNRYINESIYHQIAVFFGNDKQLSNKHGGGNYYSTMNSRLDKNLVLALCSSLKRQAQAARHSIELPEILEVMMVKTDSNAIPVLYTSW